MFRDAVTNDNSRKNVNKAVKRVIGRCTSKPYHVELIFFIITKIIRYYDSKEILQSQRNKEKKARDAEKKAREQEAQESEELDTNN